MSDTYQPSSLPGATTGFVQPARPVTPTPVAPATSTTYSPSYKPDFLGALQHFESGGQNVANTHQGTSSGQAQGYNQITTGTWKEFGGLAYAPTPLQATRDQQNAIAAKIPMGRWAPETLNYLRSHGFKVDTSKTLAQNIAMNGGTVATTPPAGSTAGTGAGVPPPSAQPGDNLMALAALSSSPGGGQKSPMDNLSSMASGGGGGGDQPQVQNNLQGQQAAAAGNIRQQQIAQRAAQLSAGLAQYAAQPLSWGAAPMGSTAGPQRPVLPQAGQQPPGVTLNSMGGQLV